MKTIRFTLLWICLFAFGFAQAQSESTLLVTVTPAQDVLPPKVGDYKANPGKYFSVSITNTTGEEVQAYLSVQIMQTLMSDGVTPSDLSLSSPPTRMPNSPIVVPANGTVDLTMEQMRRIFNHIPLSEMQFSPNLFSQFGAADYGLLPEGFYKVLLSAYRWDPLLMNSSTGLVNDPVALSNPSVTGSAFFRVCYRAQAPQFTEPQAVLGTTVLYDLEAVKFGLMNPVFAWTEPVINCWRETMPMYQYTLTVYEVLRTGEIKQTPDDALRNPYIFQMRGIAAPQCILDYSAIKKLQDGHVYVAQVTATPTGLSEMNFAMVENNGGSQLLVFTPDLNGGIDVDEGDEELPDDDEEEEDEDLTMTGIETDIGEDDALYVFRNPEVIKPDFDGNTNNTIFAGNTLYSEWKRPMFAGGEGQRQDTLKFRYKVQIYALSGYATKELALEQEPLYEGVAKGKAPTGSSSDALLGSGKGSGKGTGSSSSSSLSIFGSGSSSTSSKISSTPQSKKQAEQWISNAEEVLGLLQELATLLEKEELYYRYQSSGTAPGKNTGGLEGEERVTGKGEKGGAMVANKGTSANTTSQPLLANEQNRLKTLMKTLKPMGIFDTSQAAKAKVEELKAQILDVRKKWGLIDENDPAIGVDELEDYVKWASLSGKVSVGQVLLLRVVPECVNQESVRFYGDVNELSLMYSDKFSEAFGDACAGGILEENRHPGNFSEKEMAGKEIFVGEYVMTMNDDVKQDKKTFGWSGTGWILWEPFGQKVKVGVKFENIFINEERIMYDGTVKTETKSNWQHIKERAKAYADKYKDTSELGDWIPDDIFTEWGLDNLVGYALPAEETPLLNMVGTTTARKEANSLASKVKASKYYDYIRKGYATYDNFQKKGAGGFPDIEVFMPLQISDVKKTPVDIQILSMEFHPTFAWMNLMGMFTLPDNDITDENILIFGAPRTCMDPDRVLPGSGVVMLMSDVTLNDRNSSFDFTFRVPKNFQDPQDGCFIKWDNDTLSALSMHAEMSIPGLTKCDSKGNVLNGQKPKLEVKAWINTWEDWKGSVSMDPFTHDDVKGWVFTAQDIVYDHSQKENSGVMTFPTSQGYKKDDAGITDGNDNTWQGLFIKKLAVKLPKGLVSDSEISLSVDNMLVDVSGVSLAFNANKVLDVSYGGWKMKLDRIFMNIVQNNFKDCGFSGSMAVPLMKENMAFKCNFYPFEREDGSTDFDCILKCTDENKLKNISFDFFLAELELDQKQTYFLLESRADHASAAGERNTRVELCLGGDISIGGTDKVNKSLEELTRDLPIELRIPGIHFTQMRIANCERWIADKKLKGGEEIAEMQNTAVNQRTTGKSGYSIYEICKQNTYKFSDDFYFERGWWSVASVEKKIGPFQFGITGYEVLADITQKTAGLKVTGRIALMDKGGTTYDNSKIEQNALISVATTFNIDCTVDVLNKQFKYKETRFEDIKLNANFCDVKLEGMLKVGDGNSTDGTSKGYAGSISVKLPGDLIHFEANGGFFEHSQGYKWGYVYAGVGGKMGINITPLKITNIGAGIYFNCHASKDNKNKVTPQKGLVGVMAELGLSSSDGELIKGDFHLSVLYDKSANGGKGRLTTFLFTGDCKAAGDIIDAKMTIKWQNDNKDKYFQLTATVDASADGSKIVNALGEDVGASEIAQQMKLLNDKYEAAVGKIPTGTLQDAMRDDSKDKADKTTNANTKDVNAEKAKGPKMGASASLDLKLTFRENGQNLSKCKWHVYLGEPEEKKRCNFTLIDLKTKIVSVNIGANFYFCVGNELPNNGQLPEIPKKIRDFLNGQSKGGMEGADMSKANLVRKKALRMFNADAEINGGVMLGASWYGYVDLNLGIFYGDMGAIAGFDATLAKLKVTDCPGYGQMGYKGWYAEGQIYAYLYAKFGIHVNLGFWDKKFGIIDAGIGGVLKAGLPHPNYFVGDARIKLKLLGGLVNINRRFQFECGHVCNIWYGNPLDNFELFGDCTIGSANVKEGWAKDAELINPNLIAKPVYHTQAPMGEHFRVLDENELHKMAENYDGDITDLEMQAKRTFVFRHSNHVWGAADSQLPMLLEFTTMPDTTNIPTVGDRIGRQRRFEKLYNSADRQIILQQKAIGQTSFQLYNLDRWLKPNRYYCIVAVGSAKEIMKGYEEDPKEYNSKTRKYEQKYWKQTQFYFFRTGDANPQVDDVSDLEPYVALAFPSHNGQLKKGLKDDIVDKMDGATLEGGYSNEDGSFYITVHLEDAKRPNIALTQQLWSFDANGKQKAKAGYPLQHFDRLYWVFKKVGSTGHVWSKARSSHSDSHQNITSQGAFSLNSGDMGTLSLVYKFFEYSTKKQMVRNGYTTNSKGETVPQYTLKIVKDSVAKYKVLMALPIYATSSTWKTSSLKYSKPFVGIRLNSIKWDHWDYFSSGWPKATDENIRDNTTYRLYDPYWYLSYLANYFFIGGHKITNYSFETMETPVSESLIYYTKGGQTSGNLRADYHYNVSDGLKKIFNLSVYHSNLYSPVFGYYPLPPYEEITWTPLITTSPRTPFYYPSTNNKDRAKNLLGDIASVYYLAEKASNMFVNMRNNYWYDAPSAWQAVWNAHKNEGDLAATLQKMNNLHRSVYKSISYSRPNNSGNRTQYRDTVTIRVPWYQFPMIFGGTFNHAGKSKHFTLEESVPTINRDGNNRHHRSYNSQMFFRMAGGATAEYYSKTNTAKITSWSDIGKGTNGVSWNLETFDAAKALKHITKVDYTIYRVNSYDWNTGLYMINTNVGSNHTETTTLNNPFSNWKNDGY